MIKKYPVLLFIISALMISCGSDKTESPEGNIPPKRPNILFIMTDDHSRAAISAYGSEYIQTPNIDALANEGTLFSNCSVTNALCGPSRAVTLTSKYSHINGFKDNQSHFDGDQQTFPKLLQGAGYQTYMIGKWHLHTVPQGFDYWNVLIGQGDYYSPTMIEMGDTSKMKGYVTDLITEICIEQLNKRDTAKPFCLMMHQKAPHRNWMPNLSDMDMYKDETIPMPDNFFDDYSNRGRAAKEQDLEVKRMFLSMDMKLNPKVFEEIEETGTGGAQKGWDPVKAWQHQYDRMTDSQRTIWDSYYDPITEEFQNADYSEKELAEWKYQRYMKDYLRCIKSVDDNIGRMIKYLKDIGEWENTLVIYTSDQGFFLGEHGWYDKRFMYEESLLTPFIVKPPGNKSTENNDALTMNLDFAPTMLEYARVPIPDDMQGKSLKPVIEGKKT